MYLNLNAAADANPGFIETVEQTVGHAVSRCYQCGKCTAGCPVAGEMDLVPHQVLRHLQLGLTDGVLDSKTIWLCSACATCTTRCPMEVDIAGIMDCARVEAVRLGRVKAVRSISAFDEIFLDSVCRFGRVHELSLGMIHNLRTGKPFKDADIAMGLVLKRRFHLLPAKIKGQKEVARMFDAARKLEEKE